MVKIGYLGPNGTFTQAAAQKYLSGLAGEGVLISCHTLSEIIEAVDAGKLDQAVVPIENSIEGLVHPTIDGLLASQNVHVLLELSMLIEHHLIAHSGVTKSMITGVISIAQVLDQCQHYIQKQFPMATVYYAHSTANAVRSLAEKSLLFSHDPMAMAAIGPRQAADIYQLEVLESMIQDEKSNTTRFVVISHSEKPLLSRQCDKVSIAFATHADVPGSLYRILGEFAQREINLTKIASRPTKKWLGHYVFFIDLVGDMNDPLISEALAAVQRQTTFFKVLGNYHLL